MTALWIILMSILGVGLAVALLAIKWLRDIIKTNEEAIKPYGDLTASLEDIISSHEKIEALQNEMIENRDRYIDLLNKEIEYTNMIASHNKKCFDDVAEIILDTAKEIDERNAKTEQKNKQADAPDSKAGQTSGDVYWAGEMIKSGKFVQVVFSDGTLSGNYYGLSDGSGNKVGRWQVGTLKCHSCKHPSVEEFIDNYKECTFTWHIYEPPTCCAKGRFVKAGQKCGVCG